MEREVEALKSHRRISVNRPILDPDLPNMAAILGGGQDIMGHSNDDQHQLEINTNNNNGMLSSSSSTSSHGTPARSDSNRSGRLSYVGGVDLRDDGYPSPNSNGDGGGTRLSKRDSIKTLDGAREALGKGNSGSGRSKFTARRRGTNDPSGRGEGISISQDRLSMAGTRDGNGRSNSSSSNGGGNNSGQDSGGGPADPSHLFWVPASIHPEISPSDFRKFLQEHASRAVRDHESSSTSSGTSPPSSPSSSSSSNLSTSPSSPTSISSNKTDSIPNPMLRINTNNNNNNNSSSKESNNNNSLSPTSGLVSRSTSLARRGSTLRRQYNPDSEDESSNSNSTTDSNTPTLRGQNGDSDDIPLGSPLGLGVGGSQGLGPARSKSMRTKLGSNMDKTPTLSLDDLQKLEALAEEASLSQDPSKLRHALRRTMSVNAGSGEFS